MTNKFGRSTILAVGLLASAAQSGWAADMVATLYDMSDTKFSVRAVAPKDRIREYAICKAIWFAEKKNAKEMSVSDPIYSDPKSLDPKILKSFPGTFPGDWVVVTTTAYLTNPNPSGNPIFPIADKAAQCRRMWDWYH